MVDKLIQYLHTCSDEHILNDICQRVSELAERYAPDTLWYVETMIEMFEAAGDAVPSHSAHNLMKLVAEQEEDLHRSVVELCLKLIEKPKLPQILLYVILQATCAFAQGACRLFVGFWVSMDHWSINCPMPVAH